MRVILRFNNGNFEFGGEVGDKVIYSKSVLYIIVFKIDLDIFKAITAPCSDELADLIHSRDRDVFPKEVVACSSKVINQYTYFHEIFTNAIGNILCLYELGLDLGRVSLLRLFNWLGVELFILLA